MAAPHIQHGAATDLSRLNASARVMSQRLPRRRFGRSAMATSLTKMAPASARATMFHILSVHDSAAPMQRHGSTRVYLIFARIGEHIAPDRLAWVRGRQNAILFQI